MDATETLRQHILSSTRPSSPRDALLAALDACQDEALVAALAAAALHADWPTALVAIKAWSWSMPELSASQALLLAMSDEADVERELDQALDDPARAQGAVEALARALAPWEHAALKRSLKQDASRLATCCVLAMADPLTLRQWALSGRDEGELVDALRAMLFFDDELDEALLLDLREQLEQDEAIARGHRLLLRIEAMIAALAPARYARLAFHDELDLEWSERSPWVADLLAIHGETSWLETLAVLELAEARSAFGFAAMLAIVASASASALELAEATEAVISSHVALIDAMRANQSGWEAEALKASMHLQLAHAVGDEETTPLLIEIALHERLLSAHLPSPGVRGLPLSATLEEALDVTAAEAMLQEAASREEFDEETLCAVTRTLCDLRRHLAEHSEAVISKRARFIELLEQLADHAERALATAARRALCAEDHLAGLSDQAPERDDSALIAGIDVPVARQAIARLTERDGVAALWAARELTELPLDEALPLLHAARASCHVIRAPYLAQLIEELIFEERLDL